MSKMEEQMRGCQPLLSSSVSPVGLVDWILSGVGLPFPISVSGALDCWCGSIVCRLLAL